MSTMKFDKVMAMSMVLLMLVVSSSSSVDAFSGRVNQPTRTLTRTRKPIQQPSPCWNDLFDEKMVEDLQNQHLQMMQMQKQRQQQQSSMLSSVTMPPSSASRTTATKKFTAATTTTMNMNKNYNAVTNGIYDKFHDDLNQINIQLLRSKVSFLSRLLPQNKKQYIDRFVDFLIDFIL
jgi:hypothetical protein